MFRLSQWKYAGMKQFEIANHIFVWESFALEVLHSPTALRFEVDWYRNMTIALWLNS